MVSQEIAAKVHEAAGSLYHHECKGEEAGSLPETQEVVPSEGLQDHKKTMGLWYDYFQWKILAVPGGQAQDS